MASRTVAVIVEKLVPSAMTVEGLAVTAEVTAEGGPVKMTGTVRVRTSESVTSVAPYVTNCDVASTTVNVATPLALVVPATVVMTE